MKLNIFLLLCLTGLMPVVISTRHKYHLVKQSYSWPMAQNYCRVMYTDMATIVTDDDWLRLNKEAVSKGYTGYSWIGLYNDVNSWRWSLNELPLKNVTYTNWYSGQPDNYAGREACGIILAYGAWEDTLCTGLRPFICYNANFSGADRFIGISNPYLNWIEAQSYCRTHHTDLASSLNSSDNNFLLQLWNIQGNSWIGLYRDTWKWSDGTITSNLPWSSGQPNNYGGYENCGAYYNNVFDDYSCSYQTYFYCHTIPPVRQRQIVRLQVKSDGSVLDPAVHSSILEQIKQKLAEKGIMENTTVTWRVQPDKNIFCKTKKDDL
ncbi:C-type mannose receptor 2-like [Hemibagrus wyckioides]|uniref:C-type mannose receptor 2-like n=1 Tax=Hemibagrus wyckioides TaxID=337641 RepID=UPI00266BC313|nr:C-type mannose receptor 2-like [Hemibagrus wyckioides]